MKKQFIIASVALLLGTFACKKNETGVPQKNQESETSSPKIEVKQKMYDLSTELITESVRNFKGTNVTHSTNTSDQRTSSADVKADSSIWILEAALNYDFDNIPKGSETSNDSCGYEIDYTDGIVTSSDLTEAYNYFTQYINQKTSGTNKVKIIDITAHVNDSKIVYSANITYFPDLAQRTEGLCDPYTSGYVAYWSNYWATIHGCSSGNDGPTKVEYRANCNVAISGCNGFYWANVTTLHFYTTPNSSSTLFYCHCSNFCSTLSGTNLNTYVSACTTIGNANIPSSPSGMHIAGYDVIDQLSLDQFDPYLIYYWWQLDVTYGTYGCGSGGGGGRPF